MFKKIILTLFTGCLFLLTVADAGARITTYTSVQALVEREKLQRDFYPATDFWQLDRGVPEGLAANHVSEAVFLTLDQGRFRSFMQQQHPAIRFRVQMADQVLDLELVRYENYASDFKVEAVSGDRVRTHDYQPGLHYRGVIAGYPGSVAAFSFFEEGVYGIFSMPEGSGGNFVLAPNNLLINGEQEGRYILYNDAALVDKNPPLCATDQLPSVEALELAAGATARNVYNTCKDIEVYYQADFTTYQTYTGDVSRVANYITYVHNVVATLFANEELYVSIKIIRVNESMDDYWGLPVNASGSVGFLNKFGDLTRNNLYGADIGVMVSSKGGSMGGVAWLNGLCLPYTFQPGGGGGHAGPYAFCNITRTTQQSFPTFSWDASMITHEIGHLVGSPHTHSCSWPGGPIDGCMPPDDGNCASTFPSYPTGGGTIMSYCHLGATVSFSKGFGPLPGELIRNNMRRGKSCVGTYVVNAPLITPGETLLANRECTDADGVTYYYNDANTADKADDRLVMKIRKNGNNIGTLNTPAFVASTTTLGGLGSGSAVRFVLPAGTPHARERAFAARRYFSLRPLQAGQQAMEFILPIDPQDSTDLAGSMAETFDWSLINMYTIRDLALNPNPESGLSGAAVADLSIYRHADAPSSDAWSLSVEDDVWFARLRATNFTGGAMYVNTPFPASVASQELEAAVQVYPNPTQDQWKIILPDLNDAEALTFTLYAADGRIAARQQLSPGLNSVSAAALPPGIYFFRVSGALRVYNGTLEKI